MQYELLNNIFRQIYRCKRKQDDYVIEMVEKYNKNNEYFYFEIELLELFPKKIVYYNKNFPNLSPRNIYHFFKGK